MTTKPVKDKRYKFLMCRLQIRWVDYIRLKNIFPQTSHESASSYFRRLSLFLASMDIGRMKGGINNNG